MEDLKRFLYVLLQCTWGILQTLVGFCVFLRWCKAPHERYHGAVVTRWKLRSGMSLGLFLFVPEGVYGDGFLVHEYGHTIQSLILGPLYIPVIGLPSVLWCNLPCFVNLRRKTQRTYNSMYAERSANFWGEKITKERAEL